jgi:hypothetical protein
MIDIKSDEAVAPRNVKRQVLGISLIMLSTIAIALVPSLAKLAYDGGSNTRPRRLHLRLPNQ